MKEYVLLKQRECYDTAPIDESKQAAITSD